MILSIWPLRLGAPHREDPFSFRTPNLVTFGLIWLIVVVVVPQLLDLLPALNWNTVTFLTARLNPTAMIEYAVGIGLTVIALAATTLAVVWQLTIQKYSGNFLKVLAYRMWVIYPWLWCVLSLCYQLILWVITYSKVDVDHPASLRYLLSLSFANLALFMGVIGCIGSVARVIVDLSPSKLVSRLEQHALMSWDRLASLSAKDQSTSMKRNLELEIEWIETLIPNITKIGMTAARDGDFELLRQCVTALVVIHKRACNVIQFYDLLSIVFTHELQNRFEDVDDPYWPLGFTLKQIRELHIFAMSLPELSDVHLSKLESEWKELAVVKDFFQCGLWFKFIEEVFVAALVRNRPVSSMEMVNLALRLYDIVWLGISGNASITSHAGTLERHKTILMDLIKTLNRLLRYCVWTGDSKHVILLVDALVHIHQQNETATGDFANVAEDLSTMYVCNELVHNAVLGLAERQYDCVGEILRRLVFHVSFDTILDLIAVPIWLPEPPLKNVSVSPPLGGGLFPYLYPFKKFLVLLMAYESFQAQNGALGSYVFDVSYEKIPSWLFEPKSQLDLLEYDLIGRSAHWEGLFLGQAKRQCRRIFERLRLVARKRPK